MQYQYLHTLKRANQMNYAKTNVRHVNFFTPDFEDDER